MSFQLTLLYQALFVPCCALGMLTLDRYGAGKHQWNTPWHK